MLPTVFTPVTNTTPFLGTGINSEPVPGVLLSNYLQGFNKLTWSRLIVQGPTDGEVSFDDAAFDTLWINFFEADTSVRFSASILQNSGTTIIFTIDNGFLQNDGRTQLTGDTITAFARYFASMIYCLKSILSINVSYIEMICRLTPNYISPSEYVLLIQTFKQIATTRNLMSIFVVGPNVDMLKSGVLTDPYITAFEEGIIDAWSFNAKENVNDKSVYQASTLAARNYFFTRAIATVALMQSTIPFIPIFVTNFETDASKFSSGIDFGPSASEVTEYSFRVSDTFCGLLNSNVSSILFHKIISLGFDIDTKALYRNDGTKRFFTNALQLMSQDLPLEGTQFNQISSDGTDETIKATLVNFGVSSSSYVLLLSRAQQNDAFSGNIVVEIDASSTVNWNGSNYLATYMVDIFPSTMNVSSIICSATVTNQILNITMSKVPYSCIVIVRGTVYPTIPSPQTLGTSNINFPNVSSLPNNNNTDGDTVVLVPGNNIYTWVNNSWIQIHSA